MATLGTLMKSHPDDDPADGHVATYDAATATYRPKPPSHSGTSVTLGQPIATSADLPATGAVGEGRIAQDTQHLWQWDGTTWVDLGTVKGPPGEDSTVPGPPGDDATVTPTAVAGTLAEVEVQTALASVIDARTGTGKRPVGRDELVLSVRDQGAAGNTTTDDTAAFQAAIDAAEAAGLPVYVPAGRFRINGTLQLPGAVTIIGAGRGSPYQGSDVNNTSVIETYTQGDVFAPKTGVTRTAVTMTDVIFKSKVTPPSTLFGAGLEFHSSLIERVKTHNYGTVFAADVMGASVIARCTFAHIATEFLSGNLTDSVVNQCLISGNGTTNATAFVVGSGWSTSTVSENYIDFFKYGVRWTHGSAGCKFIGNTFDYCYRAIGGVGAAISNLVVYANHFRQCNKTNAAIYLTNPDADMQANPWCAIDADRGISFGTIQGNYFDTCDVGMRIRWYPVRDLNVAGNVYRNVPSRVDYLVAFAGTGDQVNIYVEDLDWQAVTVLPSASLTSGAIASFRHQRLVYNGVPVFNVGGTWRKFDGTVA